MSTPLFDRLRSHCQRLRLHRHHSITVHRRADSYRLKEKMKAGLLKSKTVTVAEAE